MGRLHLAALLALLSCAAAQSGVALHPADTSVGVGDTLPLSCATRASSPPIWQRSGGDPLPEGSLVNNSTYTANSGTVYQVATLFLCNVGFGVDGTYMCEATGSTAATVDVAVHTSSPSFFQLQLTGVQNCGEYLVNDVSRANKTGELTSMVLGQALGSLCSAAASSCLITEQFFDCDQDLTANSVTFRARLEHRSTDPAVSADASPLIAQIESWVTETPSITLNNQRLRFITSCPVGISGATDSYCPAIPSTASGLSADSQTVLGATIGTVVGVCVLTIIIVLLLQLVCWRMMKAQSSKYAPQVVPANTGSSDIQMGTIKNEVYAPTTVNENVAYGAAKPPKPAGETLYEPVH